MNLGHVSRPMRLGAAIATVLIFVVLAIAPCGAAEIPAWLDEAISRYNEKNPGSRIDFVAIKDSFVWYRVAATPELGQARIREVSDQLTRERGYTPADDEESVTTARPPSPDGPSGQKKCWRRSFVMNVQALSDTIEVGGESGGIRQRMLTRLVCDDAPYWDMGFRIVE